MQVCTLLQTDNHASSPPLSFLQAGCPSCRPTNSVKALKAAILSSVENKKQLVDLDKSEETGFLHCWQCPRYAEQGL